MIMKKKMYLRFEATNTKKGVAIATLNSNWISLSFELMPQYFSLFQYIYISISL